MSENDQPETASAPPAEAEAAAASDAGALPEEWKPEPREWTWKDLFTAPMLAFKPKCMLISVLTVVLMGLFSWVWFGLLYDADKAGASEVPVVGTLVLWVGYIVNGVLFGLGATLVSVFMKADLLDDEFLSLKEALGAFKGRVAAAVMVPVFLVSVLGGFKLLIYLGVLLCSIPYAGSVIYAIFYPLAWLLSLFTVLIGLGVLLSVFVGPAVISIRRHGWFDNVIDTFEAVGTKPHVLVANLAITLVMLGICYGIGHQAIDNLTWQSVSKNIPGEEVKKVEKRSSQIVDQASTYYDVIAYGAEQGLPGAGVIASRAYGEKNEEKYYDYFTGLITGGWKILITALISGYVVNVFLAGGMLTYLSVREDDYWDDEDLEDLDQLAKELEEEAKREEEKAAAEAETMAAAKPTEDAKPSEDKTASDDADTKVESDSGDDKPTDDAETKPEEGSEAGDEKKDG